MPGAAGFAPRADEQRDRCSVRGRRELPVLALVLAGGEPLAAEGPVKEGELAVEGDAAPAATSRSGPSTLY